MTSYRELEVWKSAMDLTDEIYKLTKTFPDIEKFLLVSQLRSAAISAPSNIAEGWGRESTKEYIRFLLIAKGSLMEIETQLEVSVRQKYITKEQVKPAWGLTQKSLKMLVRLIQSLRNRNK